MKSGIVPVILLLTVAIAALLFGKKMHQTDDNIDKLERAIAGVKPFLKPGSNIQFNNVSGKNELHYWARFAFTPHYLPYKTSHYDTVFTICPVLAMMPIMNTDSILRRIGNDPKNLIWQNKDDDYYYFLTCSRH